MGKAWDGKAIEEAASRPRPLDGVLRLTGSKETANRKLTARSGSGYANRAGEAGAYDFSRKGNAAFQEWCADWGAECLRVLKPGGHALVFGGTRTHHRLACGLEDAGFEIRDTLSWMYGSGFPKSLDVAKAIDKTAGVEGTRGEFKSERSSTWWKGYGTGKHEGWERPWMQDDDAVDRSARHYLAGSEDAARWQGWGTALKPAWEPIVVARKSLAGTVAANVLAHGTGALNIDGCRVAFAGSGDEDEAKAKNQHADFGSGEVVGYHGWDSRADGGNYDPPGRWPANVLLSHHDDCELLGETTVASNGHFPAARPAQTGVAGLTGHGGQDDLTERHTAGERVERWACHPDCPVRRLDEQSGMSTSGANPPRRGADGERNAYGSFRGQDVNSTRSDDSGGASRFFYCSKVSRAERNAGCESLEPRFAPTMGNGIGGKEHDPETATAKANHHPTVKPLDLMRWVIRLVAPPGALVLDPFLGSGTSGCAAALEGVRFIGVEREADYMRIAEARIAFWQEHGEDGLRICAEREASGRARAAHAELGQLDLFGS